MNRVTPRQKILFLDLEDTIIDEFASGSPINTGRLVPFVQIENPDKIAVFSHAIYDEKDKAAADERIFGWLGELCGKPICLELTPTVEELVAVVRKAKHFVTDFGREEFFDFLGKRGSFEFFVASRPELTGTECVLLDDSVESITLEHHDTGTLLRFVPAQSL